MTAEATDGGDPRTELLVDLAERRCEHQRHNDGISELEDHRPGDVADEQGVLPAEPD